MIELPEDMSEELKYKLRLDELIFGNAYFSRISIIENSGKKHNNYERIDPMTIKIDKEGKLIEPKDVFKSQIKELEKLK